MSADPTQFDPNRPIQHRGTIDQALELVVSLENGNQLLVASRRRGTWYLLAGFVAIVIAVPLYSVSTSAATIVLFLGIAAMAYGILLKRQSFVPESQLSVLRQWLKLLAIDTQTDSPIQLSLDFRASDDADLLTAQSKVGHWDQSQFVQHWFQVSGRFADKTKFKLRFTEKLRKRSRWKRSASGKSKFKSKQKTGYEALVTLSYRPEKYPSMSQMAPGSANEVALPPDTIIKAFTATDTQLTLQVAGEQETQWRQHANPQAHANLMHQVFTRSLTGAYRFLNQSRRIAKGHS